MTITLDITDQQAANLAAAHRVASFTDGTDLITQVVADSDLQASRKAIIAKLSTTSDQAVLDACATAMTDAGVAVPLPPIKILPSGGATPATP